MYAKNKRPSAKRKVQTERSVAIKSRAKRVARNENVPVKRVNLLIFN